MTISRSLSREEVRSYDGRAIDAGVPGPVLMENAARGATELLLALGVTGHVTVACGKGNNGGDGFVMARLLHCAGKSVSVEMVCPPEDLFGDAKIAFKPLAAMGVSHRLFDPDHPEIQLQRYRRSEWIVDGLLGTGTKGSVRAPFDRMIDLLNAARRKVLAVDLPSGLDADTGEPLGSTVRAGWTATFVAPKQGFENPASLEWTGNVHVVAIGAGDGFVS